MNGVRVTPRDVFIGAAGPHLRKDPQQSPDLVALRVDVSGIRRGEEVTLRWEVIDRFDPATGITAMMGTTGFSLAITGLLQLAGEIAAGVWTPAEVIPSKVYIRELARRGIMVSHHA